MNWESLRTDLLTERDRIDAILALLPAETVTQVQVATLFEPFTSQPEEIFETGGFVDSSFVHVVGENVCDDAPLAQAMEKATVAAIKKSRQSAEDRAEDKTHMGASEAILEALRVEGPAETTPIIDYALRLRPHATRAQMSQAIFYLMRRARIRKDEQLRLHLVKAE